MYWFFETLTPLKIDAFGMQLLIEKIGAIKTKLRLVLIITLQIIYM